MSKNYPEIQEESDILAEPATAYSTNRRCFMPDSQVSNRERILATTVSVDDYFDELIRQVQNDSSLSEENTIPLLIEKDVYTPEELRTILVNDLNHVYGVKEEV